MTGITSSLSMSENGLPLVNRNNLAQIAGLPKTLFRSEFDAAVSAERGRITSNGTGAYAAGEQCSIYGETGVRVWFIGASSSLSHWRTVSIAQLTILLGADVNVARKGTGVPSNALGADGDIFVSEDSGNVYTRASGVYAVTATFPTAASIAAGLGGKLDTPVMQTAVTASRAYANTDNTDNVPINGTVTLTIPSGLMSNFGCEHSMLSGTATIQAAAGVTLNGVVAGSVTRAAASNQIFGIQQLALNVYFCTGV